MSATRTHLPLAGATVLVTRPAEQAGGFAAAVRSRGGTPLRLPALALHGPEDPAIARAALAAGGQFQDWIFISPAAVRFAFLVQPELAPAARVFVVGAGSQRALARHGIRALAPPAARSDSEGLLALPQLADVRGRRIVLVGAPGGRDLIAPALESRGARVQRVHVYRRGPPRLTRRHFTALAAAPAPLVLPLSSGEGFAYLGERVPSELWQRLHRQLLVASSTRLAAQARRAGFGWVVVAENAGAPALLDAAAVALREPPPAAAAAQFR